MAMLILTSRYLMMVIVGLWGAQPRKVKSRVIAAAKKKLNVIANTGIKFLDKNFEGTG